MADENLELRGYIRAVKAMADKARWAADAPKCPANGPEALRLFATSLDQGLEKFEAMGR